MYTKQSGILHRLWFDFSETLLVDCFWPKFLDGVSRMTRSLAQLGWNAIFAPALALCVLTGAASDKSRHVSEVPGMIHVPMTRQATPYTCGAAVLASVHGTTIRSIENFAKIRNLRVNWRDAWTLKDLETSVAKGVPVIVLIQAYSDYPNVDWKNDWDDGHYVVVNGMDRNNVYMMDPSSRGTYTYIPRREFLDRWHDVDVEIRHVRFGMTISDPRKTKMSSYDRDEILRMR